MRIYAGRTARYCDGMRRRSFVQLGVAGMASLGMGQLLQAKEESATSGTAKKATSAILIWLDGGPGHMDMYDMKPDAPVEYRGIWRPISTKVPGFDITELFPKQAKVTDKFSMVRSLHHDTGDHFAGGHRMLTTKNMGVSGGNKQGRFPSLGAIVAHQRRHLTTSVPPYVSVPVASSIGLSPGYFGGDFLGAHYNPFQTKGDPNSDKFKVQNLELASGMTVDRLDDRKDLVNQLDRISRDSESTGLFTAMDRFDQQAFNFVAGEQARQAFDLSREDDKIRDLYGRHGWGQSTLLARRLVEAGASFVTVHCGGWDNHWNLQSAMERYLPKVDDLVSGLGAALSLSRVQINTFLLMTNEIGLMLCVYLIINRGLLELFLD